MTLLAGESQSDAFGPLLQIPTLYLHGQRAMQQQTAAPARRDALSYVISG
jgi:hypothetical protein